MRELIDVLQTNAPTSQIQTPASLLRMLVHVVNIQKSVDQGSDDPANAIKRLRDFANTIERLDLGDENLADAKDIRLRLIAVLRQAADQLGEPGAAATWAAGSQAAQAI
jgi:alpha-D-ribose 1-methylphosphonate 5-phosphate C-P lyase